MGYEAKSVRISTTYGSGHGLEDERVLSELILKGVENESINLVDDGTASRKTSTYIG